MTDKEIAFQKELKAVVEKYGAKYRMEYGYYETDSETHHIYLEGKENYTAFEISDLFPKVKHKY